MQEIKNKLFFNKSLNRTVIILRHVISLIGQLHSMDYIKIILSIESRHMHAYMRAQTDETIFSFFFNSHRYQLSVGM